jgi:gliding motility-associated lipoprotein GldH
VEEEILKDQKRMIIRRKNNALFFGLLLLIICSCDANRVYEKNVTLPEKVWDKENELSFDVEIDDTVSSHNIYVNIRNASHYSYSNLYLFVTTTAPSGAAIRDTFECILADEKGKWLGEGLGDIWDNQIPFKRNVRFPLKGIYRFNLTQAMRQDQLPFIMDAGIRIERIEFK